MSLWCSWSLSGEKEGRGGGRSSGRLLADPEDFHATPATTENASPVLITARPTSEHSPNISSLSVYNNLG